MLTRRGRLCLGLAFALIVAGRILGVTELFAVAVAIAAVVGAGVLRARSPQLRVTASSRVVPSVVTRGEPAALELSIENSGFVPTPAGRLHLVRIDSPASDVVEVPRLVPGERASVSLPVPTEQRGRHEVRGYDAVLTDALGTARRRLTGVGAARYAVRPTVEALSGALPSGDAGLGLETTRSSAERLRSGASLLRPYVDGDDLRRVHWATTARVGDLMVREGGDRERDSSSGATIVLSPFVVATPGMSAAEAGERFDDAVAVAASLAAAATREGALRLIVPGDADTGDGMGPRHLDTVLELLTDAKPLGAVDRGTALATAVDPNAVAGRVAHFVGCCATTDEVVAMFGTSPERLAPRATAVVVVCVGADEPGIERVGGSHLVVRLPIHTSLRSLWEAGDSALGRA